MTGTRESMTSLSRTKHRARPDQEWLECTWLDEPLLAFARGGKHVSPRAGIARYGPGSLETGRHPAQVRIGIIAPGDLAEQVQGWLKHLAEGVSGTETTPEFPGWRPDRGFLSEMQFSGSWNEILSQAELRAVEAHDRKLGRFEAIVNLIDDKLRLIAQRDRPPDVVYIGLPDDLVRSVGTWMSPARGISSFRDLRRAVKGKAMRWGIPTQFLRQFVVEGRDATPIARIAWNLFTASTPRPVGPLEPDRLARRHLLRGYWLLPAARRGLDHADQPGPGLRRTRRGPRAAWP